MIWQVLPSVRVRFAAACCALAVALLGLTTRDAMRPPQPRYRVSVLRSQMPSIEVPPDTSIDQLMESALDHDPFSLSGQSPSPPRAAPTPTVAAREVSAPEVLRLVGTVVDSSGGSFVLCQLGNGSARVLRVGQEVGVYQLHSISQGAAIFVTGDGQRLELRVPKAGS